MIESKYSSPINILRCTISCNAEICPNVIDNDANSWNVWRENINKAVGPPALQGIAEFLDEEATKSNTNGIHSRFFLSPKVTENILQSEYKPTKPPPAGSTESILSRWLETPSLLSLTAITAIWMVLS
ncbi:hypothetical protein K432DRAFT_462351 [Lepidopterella palustris CBS 459.81]|uniref:Uncharacterized protein n=1 Tax=Lepidopterella palustris CBS 459.81 TaxID=1314670 RepID=A0A8E2JBY7_9PEZI|nr:hypothetical protein K432DRAFT_462351 [Lepidopterella palustris CBS 459.81]